MVQEQPRDASKHDKLARLPSGHKICKRPLIRPAISSRYASSDARKLVYISTRTPFMSIIKRVQTLLRHVEARGGRSVADAVRAAGGSSVGNPRKRKAETLDPAVVATRLAARRIQERAREVSDEVAVRASGRAIERALSVARWFEDKGDYRIAVRTGTTTTIDDIERVEGEDDGGLGQDETQDLPEARIRHVSHVEIAVALA